MPVIELQCWRGTSYSRDSLSISCLFLTSFLSFSLSLVYFFLLFFLSLLLSFFITLTHAHTQITPITLVTLLSVITNASKFSNYIKCNNSNNPIMLFTTHAHSTHIQTHPHTNQRSLRANVCVQFRASSLSLLW
jgi:hypothetical protein